MTSQIPDYVTYKREEYRIVGIKGEGLPQLEQFNIQPQGFNSACWRGYHMGYTVIADELLLTRLTVIGHIERMLDGIQPAPGRVYESHGIIHWGDTEWMGIQREIPFSGRLLLGRDFIYNMYVHMGFQKPTAFRKVIELTIEAGVVVEAFDISTRIGALREKILEVVKQEKALSEKEHAIDAWVEHMFSLDYDAWWWN